MVLMPTICPECGSDNVEELEDGRLKCLDCGHKFGEDESEEREEDEERDEGEEWLNNEMEEEDEDEDFLPEADY